MEALPTRFYRSVTNYWSRRKYQKIDGSGGAAKKTLVVTRLGDGRPRRRFWRLHPVRVKTPSAARILRRVKDAYMDSMVGIAVRGGGLAAPARPEAALARKNTKASRVRLKPEEFEKKLVMEIYKSLSEPLAFLKEP